MLQHGVPFLVNGCCKISKGLGNMAASLNSSQAGFTLRTYLKFFHLQQKHMPCLTRDKSLPPIMYETGFLATRSPFSQIVLTHSVLQEDCNLCSKLYLIQCCKRTLMCTANCTPCVLQVSSYSQCHVVLVMFVSARPFISHTPTIISDADAPPCHDAKLCSIFSLGLPIFLIATTYFTFSPLCPSHCHNIFHVFPLCPFHCLDTSFCPSPARRYFLPWERMCNCACGCAHNSYYLFVVRNLSCILL